MAVEPTPRDLCSLERARRAIQLRADQVANNDLLRELITEVSGRFHRFTGREFVALNAVFTNPVAPVFGEITVADETRSVYTTDSGELRVGDLQAITSALANGAAIDIAGWQRLPLGPAPWSRIRYVATGESIYRANVVIAITGKWGFPEVPDEIQGACAKQVKADYSRLVGNQPEVADDLGGERRRTREFIDEVYDTLMRWRRIGPVFA